MRWILLAAAVAGIVAACASVPPPRPPAAPADPAGPAVVSPAPAGAVMRSRSRWIATDWSDLPGWQADRLIDAWPAMRAGCDRPPADWVKFCAVALVVTPADEASLRALLQQRLQPYRVEALDGAAEGLATGYFEPLVTAQRERRGAFRTPLHAPPPDLATRKPYWTRQQLETVPAAQAALRGRELAHVADPLDALLLQVQGSGRLQLTEADGRSRLVRMAYAGHNDQPYKSVGRWLIEQGEVPPGEASWPQIRAWARANPRRVNEMLWANPRVVFFREEPIADASVGPRGAMGVPLTPGRSIAVDPLSIPYGTPVWLDTTEPLRATPLRRLVMAQDTGSAIVGAVRADYFWGWGDEAEAQAGRMKQPLRMWVLWPRQD